MNKSIVALMSLLAALPAAASRAQEGEPQPSFDCAAATQAVEEFICADVGLSALDRELAAAYRERLSEASGDAQSAMRLAQRAWSGNRATACGVDAGASVDVDAAIGCLTALYRARIDELSPGGAVAVETAPTGGYAWLMGTWRVTALRAAPVDPERAAEVEGWVGRELTLSEAPIADLDGDSCSLPRYHAEPAPGPEFGDLSQFPAAVMVRVSCVGVALLDLVRLTEERVLLSEGEAVLELERRR